jgi:tetratricopeptide (TPR) repeat protein
VAVDRSTLLENAQRLAARGQLEKAIEEWNKLAAESPSDGTIFNTIGDLHLKRNAPQEAIEAYFRAASAFQQRGFALKTIAVYKKILKIEPSRFEVYRHLGDLNAERGLIRNAIADYLTVARAYLKEGNTRRSLELYRTIAKLDPGNIAVRQRVAELAVKEKLVDEAIVEYLEVAKECLAQQRLAEAKEAYRAILELNPDHREAQQGLSGTLAAPNTGTAPPPVTPEPELTAEPEPSSPQLVLAPPEPVLSTAAPAVAPAAPEPRVVEPQPEPAPDLQTVLDRATKQFEMGQYAEAGILVTQVVNGDPGNSDARQLLALVKLKTGDLPGARVEIESIVEAALREQDTALAESALRQYLSVDPKCVSVLERLGQVYEKSGDAMSATIQYGKAIETLLEQAQVDRAALPAELYARIKALAPDSPLIKRFADVFSPSRLTEDAVKPVLELEIGYHHDVPGGRGGRPGPPRSSPASRVQRRSLPQARSLRPPARFRRNRRPSR